MLDLTVSAVFLLEVGLRFIALTPKVSAHIFPFLATTETQEKAHGKDAEAEEWKRRSVNRREKGKVQNW